MLFMLWWILTVFLDLKVQREMFGIIYDIYNGKGLMCYPLTQ